MKAIRASVNFDRFLVLSRPVARSRHALSGIARRCAAGLVVLLILLRPYQSASAADYQIIALQPGQTTDVYFEFNLSGQVSLRIVTQLGPGCAEMWWITWPLGRITSIRRKCGSVRLPIPGCC
jgi:hypothetical protein